MAEFFGVFLEWGVFVGGLLICLLGDYDMAICILLAAIYLRLEA